MDYIIGFIIAAAIGAWVTSDANSRGMNGRFWGISTILVMIVALPIYLIVRKPRLKANSH
ncbi:hypothetical protein MesoLj131b_70800 (plasmid) [Mesorhizobium sp. 131-2-5]|uniref:Msl9175 protein n=1 Tax=Mesorhizobium japonicum (strain LMG 29417 / CECT 9101 / MAFF 303099) TaxID=266835 RepID=Q981Z2_RHILO|nr:MULTISPECIES: hypothetical protein [Mesorhizobium]BAB54567.1 msl9175 [Mesorhizobium japonicum MAFF 303099]BCH05081.1 hypothetical protein MesoLj131b_70800 [Mesorhizobium sp. 131-2-5]